MIDTSLKVKCDASDSDILVYSKYLRFCLRLSLSLNGRMAIPRQNSHRITIWLFDWLSQILLTCQSPFRLKTQMQPEAYRMHTYNEVPYRWRRGVVGAGAGPWVACQVMSNASSVMVTWDPCELNDREIELKTWPPATLMAVGNNYNFYLPDLTVKTRIFGINKKECSLVI